MVEKGIIKSGQVVFLYSKPPEQSLIGYVDNVAYPIITVLVVPRSVGKNKFGKVQEIDISKDVALTIMTDDRLEEYLTPTEKKRLKALRKDRDYIDLFASEYS